MRFAALTLAVIIGVASAASLEKRGGDESLVSRMLSSCTTGKNVQHCLKLKAFYLVNSVIDGSAFSGDTDTSGRSAGNEESVQESQVDSVLLEQTAKYFNTHSLKIGFPKDIVSEIGRSFSDARTQRRQTWLPLLLFFGLGGVTLVPMLMSGLAIFAGKAFFTSVLALFLPVVIGIKKLFGGSGVAAQGAGGYYSLGNPYYAAPHNIAPGFDSSPYVSRQATAESSPDAQLAYKAQS